MHFLNNKILRLAAIFLIATILALWKFSDVLFEPLLCLTNQGDGLGGLGQFALANPLVQKVGLLNYLFSDINQNPLWGAGLMPPTVSTVLWKSIILLLFELGLSPDNIWDIIAFGSFILTIIAGYLLALELGAPFFLALASGLFFAHLDVFKARIQAHLFLATYFFSILQVLWAIKSGKEPSLKNLIVFALLSAICFAQNEYYGYLGSIFSIIIFLGYFIYHNAYNFLKNIDNNNVSLLKNIFISGLLFIFTMFVIYPNYLGNKLISLFGEEKGKSFSYLDHNINEVFVYSVNEPLALFKPSLSLLNIFNWQFQFINPGEFTFRIGFVILLGIVITLILCLILHIRAKKVNAENSTYKLLHHIIIFSIAATVMALIGLSPIFDFSLALFSFKIAPTFRVVARSYLFVDFAIIIIFVIATSWLWIKLSKDASIRRYASVFILLLSLLSFRDLSGSFLPQKELAFKLPKESLIFNVLREKPTGWLLEVPFYTSHQSPEINYIYFYNYSIHKKPIINGAFHLLPKTNPEIDTKIIVASGEINRPSEKTIKKLGLSGVRYLSVHNDVMDYSYLDNYSSSISKIGKNQSITLYEILDVNSNGNFIDYLASFNECCSDLPILKKNILPISASDCRSRVRVINKTTQIKTKNKDNGFFILEVEVSNLGNIIWGGQNGLNILLGLVWFNADKTDNTHSPNYGEERFPIPKSLKPGESTRFNIMVDPYKKAGKYQLWLSPMQPGVMWCFHVGDIPEKLNIEVQ